MSRIEPPPVLSPEEAARIDLHVVLATAHRERRALTRKLIAEGARRRIVERFASQLRSLVPCPEARAEIAADIEAYLAADERLCRDLGSRVVSVAMVAEQELIEIVMSQVARRTPKSDGC